MGRCIACARHVAARWSRCPWCHGWTGQARDASDAWRDARLDGLRVLGLAVAGWIGVVALVANSGALDTAILTVTALVLAIAHLALPWHPFAWWTAEGAWAGATILAPLLFRDEPSVLGVAGATALPLALFILMRAVRWPLLDRLRGRGWVEDRPSSLVRFLRVESRALAVVAALVAGLIVLPLMVGLLFPD